MSKKKGSTLNDVAEGVILVFLAILALTVTPFVMVFFVPVVAYYVWRLKDKNKEFEGRLAKLEKPLEEPQPDQ